jgi:hypothetical protein
VSSGSYAENVGNRHIRQGEDMGPDEVAICEKHFSLNMVCLRRRSEQLVGQIDPTHCKVLRE